MIVQTPCVGVCSVHPEYNLCRGCLRSPLEIRNWVKYSEDMKLELLELLDIKREIFEDSLMEGFVKEGANGDVEAIARRNK